MIGAGYPAWIPVFTGLSVCQFGKLVGIAGCATWGGLSRGPAVGRAGVAAGGRNLTLRQVALLFGVSKSAAGRVVDHLGLLLALSSVTRRHSPNTVLIVDGTLVLSHDRSVSASSKNYRYSTNLQVVTELVVAVGRPLPGNRHDCCAYAEAGIDCRCAEAAVGGYPGTGLIMPYRKPRDGSGWKEDLNTGHRRVRAKVEHALAHMKSWNILRNCRRKGDGVYHATRAVALMRNLAMTG